MAFNHYAKIKKILDEFQGEWHIQRINQPTTVKKFNGKIIKYPYYYRIYDKNNQPIKYCKFQQINRLAKILDTPTEDLPIIN